MMSQHTKRAIIISTVLMLVAICAYVALSYFTKQTELNLSEEMQVSVNTRAKLQELTTLTRVASESRDERNELESYILADEDVIDFLTLIESVGREQGTDLSTELNVTPLAEPFELLNLRISVEGNYNAVLHVLRVLEQLPYQLAFTKVVFTGDDGVWNADIQITVTKFLEQ